MVELLFCLERTFCCSDYYLDWVLVLVESLLSILVLEVIFDSIEFCLFKRLLGVCGLDIFFAKI
jgi:hypothetical protein